MSFEKIMNGIAFLGIIAIIFQPLIGMKIYYAIMALLVMVTMLDIIKKGKIKINFFEVTYVIFIILEFISKIYAISQETANYAIKETTINFIISFCIVAYTQRDQKTDGKYSKILDVFSYSTVFICMYLLIFDAKNVIGTRDRLGRLLYLDYGTYMVLSYIIIISLCYMLWKCVYSIKKVKIIDYTCIIILLLTAIISGTRKTLFCPIIFFIFIILYKFRKNYIKIMLYTFIIAIISMFLYNTIMNNENLYKIIGVRVESTINKIVNRESSVEDASTEERKLLKQLAMEAFNEKMLFGWGINNFANYSEMNSGPFLYAHCNYLELMSSLGIIGTTIYYMGYLYIIVKAIKKARKNDQFSVFILCFMLMNLISDYETVSYIKIQYILIYVLFAKYVCSESIDNKKEGKNNAR